ncbi:Nitrogen assimilation transcription factor nirA [Ilyonectria robusta]
MALEARVASLEKMLAIALQRPAANNCNCNGKATATIVLPDPAFITAPFGEEEDEKSVDELADTLGCFTLGDTGELRFFGASSNFNIIQNPSLKVASSVEARNLGIAAARQMPDFFEPTNELRDHLLGLYWRWQNSWQYIVPRESFVLDLYVEKSGRFCTPLLLTAILALASRYSSHLELRTDPTDPNTAGEAFAAQAKTMLHCEYEAPTTSTVQATALLGLFWASVDNEGLGFMYIGMASRMAMNLGLQSDLHPAFTAAIIHLLDLKSTGSSTRSEARRCLYICIKALYEMNTNWNWANRSIRAIQSLADQWEVDIWTSGLRDEISVESQQHFERYEGGRGRLLTGFGQESTDELEKLFPTETLDDLFNAWTYEQNSTSLAFNFIDQN